jgi:succinate dehydrogenase/fumarate reductase flavoprotein subunit
MEQNTFECDVLVVGSGASGMSTAITAASQGLKVLVVDKEPRFGGTTARSGGWLWIPGTRLATEQGIHEPEGAALAYMKHETTTHFDAARVGAFLDMGPKAIDFFTRNTCVQFDMPPVFPDYHAEAPGGQQGGRSMVTRPFDGRELGARVKQLAPPLPELTVFGMMLGSGPEIKHFMRAFKSPTSFWYVTKRLTRHFLDVLGHGRGMTLTNGNALAGRLAKAAMDLDIPVWLSTPVKKLVVEYDGVSGAVVQHEGKAMRIAARRGVVLACGGFPYDVERRKQLFPHAPTGKEHYSPSPSTNTGDGLRLAEAVGGRVDGTIPHAAAWVPASVTTRPDGTKGVMPHFIDRAKPGVIAVTPKGKRFANEGNSYHDFVQSMVKACASGRARGHGLAAVRPQGAARLRPGLRRAVAAAHRAPPEERLPEARREHRRAGPADRHCPEAVLEATVQEFNNRRAHRGRPALRQGQQGLQPLPGRRQRHAQPVRGAAGNGPYYAIKLVVGDIGTFAGLVTDEKTRVLDADRQPIKGLYAVGNDAASVMGGNYPGAGITLGPALTFGYVAGLQLAQAEALATVQLKVEQREAVPLARKA